MFDLLLYESSNSVLLNDSRSHTLFPHFLIYVVPKIGLVDFVTLTVIDSNLSAILLNQTPSYHMVVESKFVKFRLYGGFIILQTY